MNSTAIKERKATGSHYTPTLLANFVASQIVGSWTRSSKRIRILDPAIGDGELLLAIVAELHKNNFYNFDVFGFDTNENAIDLAAFRIKQKFESVNLSLKCSNFLDFVLDNFWLGSNRDLFEQNTLEPFDLIISNPPYVRTQVMGAEKAQALARQFSLSGRVDLYFAFIKGIAKVLRIGGIVGIIVSNRFMLTKSGAEIRQSIQNEFEIIKIWDFGDTKLFEAAVLPAVLLLKRNNKNQNSIRTKFTTIYAVDHGTPIYKSKNVIDALRYDGIVKNADGRFFSVQHGYLDRGNRSNSVWRISTRNTDEWLNTVKKNTFCT
ncbi:MAG: Eco57I restriction-modification methylase domain-containing protein, partial [bacterium]